MAEDDTASDSPDFADGVLKSLDKAVAEALDGDPDAARKQARDALEKLVSSVTGAVSDARIEDPCKSASQDKNPAVASACLTKQLAPRCSRHARHGAPPRTITSTMSRAPARRCARR